MAMYTPISRSATPKLLTKRLKAALVAFLCRDLKTRQKTLPVMDNTQMTHDNTRYSPDRSRSSRNLVLWGAAEALVQVGGKNICAAKSVVFSLHCL
jgi:hypothetical protein